MPAPPQPSHGAGTSAGESSSASSLEQQVHAATAALRNSEEKLRLAMRAADIYLWDIDIRTGETTFSDNVNAVLGFPMDQQPGDVMARIDQLIAPEERDRQREAAQRAMRGEAEFHEITRLIHPYNGQQIWIEGHGVVIRGRDGTPERLIGLGMNITARKRHEGDLALLSDISKELDEFANIEQIMAAVGAKLCDHFNTVRCNFAEIDDDAGTAVIAHEWHRSDVPAISGPQVHRLRDFISDAFLQAARAGQIIVVSDTRTDPRTHDPAYAAIDTRAFVMAPFVNNNRWRALLSISDRAPRVWRDDEVELMRELTTRIWTKFENRRAEGALRHSEESLRRLNEDLEERIRRRASELSEANAKLHHEARDRRTAEAQITTLFQRLASAQEDERRSIARDIHDQLGQQMTALRLNIEVLRSQVTGDRDLTEQTNRSQRLAEELDRSIDTLTSELRPTSLDKGGLPAALHQLVHLWSERFRIPSQFVAFGDKELHLSPETEINLYRLVQEALHNIAKHAAASNVSVVLQANDQPRELLLVIEDDGQGFDPHESRARSTNSGLGLISMGERAMLSGGTLTIESAPGKGTSVFVRVAN